ncbi:hypothetical protein [Natranaerobius trueperi]|uniref:Uncharacterized protein n=1 Tax=Natranaerobius trueperi TaxID=759412 RepID=A0A226BXH4_9FIRM|nr:hypothetical protein [Natranaerobius trueperi]OWZ83034.1 hypothetical protein CDO51_10750 [Natranaerobius trueperi]
MKKIFMLLLTLFLFLFVYGCEDEANHTGEELLEIGIKNLEKADSYRSDIHMDMNIMDVVMSYESDMKYLGKNNYYLDMTMSTMGQEVEGALLNKDGNIKVETTSPTTNKNEIKEMQEQLEMDLYDDYSLLVENAEIKKIENLDGYENGYETFEIMPDPDKVMDLTLEEFEEQHMPEVDDSIVDSLINNLKTDMELLLVIDAQKEKIVFSDIDVTQTFDMESIAEETDEREMTQLGSVLETEIRLEQTYYDYNESMELPEL